MASRTDSQTNWWSESNLQRLGRRNPEEIQRPTSPITTPSQPALVVLKTGDEASEQPAVSPCGSKTVALFFITYFMHTSLAKPLSWSSSLMVSLLEEFDFRNVGRYLLHENLSRAQNSTGSSSSGVILQGYPKTILTKLYLQWWSDFERRLDAGDIEFQDFLMHDSTLLILQPDSKIQERGLPCYAIKDTDPTSLATCFEVIRQLSRIPFIDTLVSNMPHDDEEHSAVNFDQSQLFEHLANFRNVQTIIRQGSEQSAKATQQSRAGDLSKMAEKGLRPAQQIHQGRDMLPLQRSDSSGMPRWARQMHDDRHRPSNSSTHVAGPSGRDRYISMSNETFFSSRTHDSKDTFVTASEGLRSSDSLNSLPIRPRQRPQKSPFHSAHSHCKDGPYFTLLQSKGLWPPHPTREHNWSGRGQHVEFQHNERQLIKETLDTSSTLGCTNSAVVEIVKCKRIYLARKTIFCSKRFTKQQAIEEVAHLEKIQHSHIVRVIGTYTIANEFSILLYPVAEYNLESFLQELRDHCDAIDTVRPGYLMALKDFFGCLSNAVAFIHSKMTKHMDIKPKNILVRKVYGKSSSHQSPWKVYIADFGIARSYSSIAASETEGPTMFTRRYAAPEVVEQDRRGLQADIFSLGCVFVEIGATIAQIHPNGTVHSAMSVPVEDLDERLASNGNSDSSYHANIRTVQEFIHQLNLGKILRYYLQFRLRYAHDIIAQMLEPYPTNRPTARVVAAYFGGGNTCCQDLPDPLEDNPPKMHEEFDRHLKDHNMWGKLNKVHRPPSPVNLGGEKNSSYRMSSLSLHSTSNLNY